MAACNGNIASKKSIWHTFFFEIDKPQISAGFLGWPIQAEPGRTGPNGAEPNLVILRPNQRETLRHSCLPRGRSATHAAQQQAEHKAQQLCSGLQLLDRLQSRGTAAAGGCALPASPSDPTRHMNYGSNGTGPGILLGGGPQKHLTPMQLLRRGFFQRCNPSSVSTIVQSRAIISWSNLTHARGMLS